MTQSTSPPIPPLQSGPKKKAFVDLMRPGDGTPWENRGDVGAVGGLLGTCIRAITKPGALLDHIRNTNVPGDTGSFVWICGVFWAMGVITHRVVNFFRIDTTQYDVDSHMYMIETLILAAIAVPWVFVMHKLLATAYYKLVQTEFRSPVPKVLISNVVAYCLGASLLAPIPFYIGPGLAVIFITIAMIVAGVRRLYISWRGAIIDSILAIFCALALTAALGLVAHIVWSTLLDNDSIREKVVQKAPAMYQ